MAKELVKKTLCRIDHELPTVVKSRTDIEAPKRFQPNTENLSLIRAKFRKDREDPSVMKSNRDREEQKRARFSNLQYPDPTRANCRKDIEEPTFRNSIIDIEFPKRAKLLIDKVLPKLAKSSSANEAPKRTLPSNEREEPSRAHLRTDIDEARHEKSKTAREDPI